LRIDCVTQWWWLLADRNRNRKSPHYTFDISHCIVIETRNKLMLKRILLNISQVKRSQSQSHSHTITRPYLNRSRTYLCFAYLVCFIVHSHSDSHDSPQIHDHSFYIYLFNFPREKIRKVLYLFSPKKISITDANSPGGLKLKM
jgi:hypothetical protein